MCGICGLLDLRSRPIDPQKLSAMTLSLLHRGPDEEGSYISPNGSVGFGFRRLSIIDLSLGHQPMRWNNCVAVFNGEIYNYKQLRQECEAQGERFSTESDTEVLLRLFCRYGEKCLEKLNGMFAFAVWNLESQELFLARDRLGIKPLYYYADPNVFIFGSEIRAIYKSGQLPLTFDPEALWDYYSYRFVPGPYTVLQGVRKVMPGAYLKLKQGKITENRYWSLPEQVQPFHNRSSDSLSEELLALLTASVDRQMVSDVPVGAFLSGGVDSSLIAALMAQSGRGKIKTFSIGFTQSSGVDESSYAQQVAKVVGSEHHSLILTERDLLRSDSFLKRMNEPVADPTVLPTAILSEYARREVKVVLTGEGGDELFAGYNRYKSVLISDWIASLPDPLARCVAPLGQMAGKGSCFKMIPNVNAARWFDANRDFDPQSINTLFNDPFRSGERTPGYLQAVAPQSAGTRLTQVLDLELKTALTDRLLMKVDMATMGQSLEARPPFLDHKVVEFAARVPDNLRIRFFKGKYILRKAASQLLPSDIVWRKKHGFIVPLKKWMSARPRDWMEERLSPLFFQKVGCFNPKAVQNVVEKIYNSQDSEAAVILWPLIVLSAWVGALDD